MLLALLFATMPLFPPELGGDPAAAPGWYQPAPGSPPVIADRAVHLLPPTSAEQSKKARWLAEKAARLDVHLSDQDLARLRKAAAPTKRRGRRPAARNKAPTKPTVLVATRIEPVTTLFNLKTRESLPLIPINPDVAALDTFLRDHFTNQATDMDDRLLGVLTKVAKRFSARRIEVISGYRSPKYNLILRKKGREVARTSQHSEGNAVDFRIRGVPTRRLLNFVKSLRLGGVGFYPHSQFVHSDTGRIRYWRGS